MKRKRAKYKQGKYEPIHPDKYKGKVPIFLRSSWEFKLAHYLDHAPSIIEWASESVAVRYFDPVKNRQRNYFIDFTILVKDKNGNLNKYYCEVKPYKETQKPVKGKKRQATFIKECCTFATNTSKWVAAKKYAKTRGAKFIILTEHELMI